MEKYNEKIIYKIRRLQKEEIIKSFNCGDADLNDFILNESVAYRKALLAVSYIIADENNPDNVLAYCSLANDRISITDFENKTAFNRFRKHRFVNEKRLKSYPAAKICRLAVQTEVKGNHLGTDLLNLIKDYFVVDNKTGCRFITVDAYASAVPFYLKNGFVPLTTDDDDSVTHLLYFDLAELADEPES